MTAVASQGTLLKYLNSSYITVTQRTSVKPNAHTRAKLETTDLDSTWETSIAGIPRAGEIEMEGNYDAGTTSHAYLWASLGTGTVETWQLILTDSGGAIFAFSGWIASMQLGEAKTDGIQKFTIKIQITGASTLTP